MLSKLTTIKVTFIGIGILILLLLTGVLLTHSAPHTDTLRSLSRQLPLTWLLKEGRNDLVVTFWFLLLCAVATFFFIHLALCIGVRLYRRLTQNGLSLRQWCFFILHVLFLAVMLCHGLNMILGYKISDIKMVAGDRYHFEDTYELSLSDIRFVDDPDILKTSYPQRRTRMTRENIHRKANSALAVLKKNGQIITSDRLFMLSPVRAGSIRVTLTDFFIPNSGSGDTLGVKLVITRNPIVTLFFGTYAALIIVFGLYVALNWCDVHLTQKDQTFFERKLK